MMPVCRLGKGRSRSCVDDPSACSRRVLGVLGCGRPPGADTVEIAVLRYQLAVLRRQMARPRYTPADRMLLAVLAKLLPPQRWVAFLMTPSTSLRWHRQ